MSRGAPSACMGRARARGKERREMESAETTRGDPAPTATSAGFCTGAKLSPGSAARRGVLEGGKSRGARVFAVPKMFSPELVVRRTCWYGGCEKAVSGRSMSTQVVLATCSTWT